MTQSDTYEKSPTCPECGKGLQVYSGYSVSHSCGGLVAACPDRHVMTHLHTNPISVWLAARDGIFTDHHEPWVKE